MPLYKKLDCDAKSEPPYLATTHLLSLKIWVYAQHPNTHKYEKLGLILYHISIMFYLKKLY
jgi:hypothetical protein